MSSHGASDSGMQKMMLMVGLALVVLTVIIMITARSLSSGSNDEFDALLHNAKLERIQPVGQVRTEAPVETVVAAVATQSGEDLAKNGVCAACHVSGAGGAPMFTATDEWAKRAEAGLDALVASVINGKGSMPARGGSDYTDEQIELAVAYMIGMESEAAEPEAAAEPAAETMEASAEEATEADATDATEETAEVADDAGAEATEETAQVAETDNAAETEAAEEAVAVVEEAAAEEATVAAADTTEADAAPAAEGVLAALTPRIKTTVDQGICAGCHMAGVAGAPKFDDSEEWAKRAEKGYAMLAQTVAMGKGAMPPRGGSDLTDDELLVAVEYMVQKSQ